MKALNYFLFQWCACMGFTLFSPFPSAAWFRFLSHRRPSSISVPEAHYVIYDIARTMLLSDIFFCCSVYIV